MLRSTLREAHLEGLDSTNYRVSLLDRNWQAREPSVLAQLELILSSAALDYGHDLMVGRDHPDDIDPLWHIPVMKFDGIAVLEKLSDSGDIAHTLASLAPPHPEYQHLRNALAYYQELALLGGWPSIPDGPNLRVGDNHPQVAQLRQRLFIEGDLVLDISNEAQTFDNILKVAVERFQLRHGLKVDGIVGPSTRAAMNISIGQRIAQIKLNMERWRWLPRKLGQRYIVVNNASFQLSAYVLGKPVLAMEVIVGTRDRPTPSIAGNLHSVTFNPYWTAPATIIIKDLIPEQLRNPNYLSARKIRVYRNGMEIDPRSVDWRKVTANYLPYILRQDPGPRNPLGRVKFLFNNNFEIYLHDTPQQGLFTNAQRAFSSGCIRVSKAETLATFVLAGNDNGWDRAAVRKALASKEHQTVTLDTPLPVYLLYFTAWVGSDNRVQFRDDIYQLDNSTPFCPDFSGTSR